MNRFKSLLLLTLCFSAEASYRVYKLKLSHFNKKGKVIRKQVVLSTLDHLQYAAYHAKSPRIRVDLVDTWYCPGDTSKKVLCNKPKLKPTRGPASTEDTRAAIPRNRQPVIP